MILFSFIDVISITICHEKISRVKIWFCFSFFLLVFFFTFAIFYLTARVLLSKQDLRFGIFQTEKGKVDKHDKDKLDRGKRKVMQIS